MSTQKKKINWKAKLSRDQLFTIPNILSFFRILLIPIIVYLYVYANLPIWTIVVIAISGLTDVVDGFIARRCNMITDFGKALDPVADKLTQVTILACLIVRYNLMALLLGFMLVKEIISLILRIIVFKRTEDVHGAEWHGKVNTVLLYVVMSVHVIWYNIPSEISIICILSSLSMMILSSVLYTVAMAVILAKTKMGARKSETISDEK